MMKIKALMIAAACAFVLPAFAADTDKATDKAADKAKAEAKSEVKKPVVREKFAGEIKAPVVKKDAVDIVSDTSQPFTLKNSRWVHDEDRER